MFGDTFGVYGTRIRGPFTACPVDSRAWINHYWCRSLEEYKEKIKRGRVDVFEDKRGMNEFDDLNEHCVITDTRARNRL